MTKPLTKDLKIMENEINDNKINGKTIEEVLGKGWKEKINNLKGDEILKEEKRLIKLIDEEKAKERNKGYGK